MKEYAIVTFVVGENYTDIFNIVKSSWQNYANKCEADLIVMDDYIDYNSLNGRSPIWQKLLLINSPHLKKYKKVCYLDSDIYINSKSPSVFEVNVFNKVGVVRHESLFYPQSHVIQYERWIKLIQSNPPTTLSSSSFPSSWKSPLTHILQVFICLFHV